MLQLRTCGLALQARAAHHASHAFARPHSLRCELLRFQGTPLAGPPACPWQRPRQLAAQLARLHSIVPRMVPPHAACSPRPPRPGAVSCRLQWGLARQRPAPMLEQRHVPAPDPGVGPVMRPRQHVPHDKPISHVEGHGQQRRPVLVAACTQGAGGRRRGAALAGDAAGAAPLVQAVIVPPRPPGGLASHCALITRRMGLSMRPGVLRIRAAPSRPYCASSMALHASSSLGRLRVRVHAFVGVCGRACVRVCWVWQAGWGGGKLLHVCTLTALYGEGGGRAERLGRLPRTPSPRAPVGGDEVGWGGGG